MNGLTGSLEKAILSIDDTTALFYQQKIEEGYKKLESTIILLSETINDIYAYELAGNQIGMEENQLVETLTEAMKAMEEKDTVLLSDILQYDLKEIFEKILLLITSK